MNRLVAFLGLACWGLLLCAGCGSADRVMHDNDGFSSLPPSTSPESLFVNLDYAINHKNIALFGDLLDENYRFLSTSQIDALDIDWGKTQDVTLTGRVFAYFDKIEYELLGTGAHWVEYGINLVPEGATDISDEHPDENWEVFRRPVTMALLDETGTDGYFIQTDFEFKMRMDKDASTGEPILDLVTGEPIWKIVRWTEHSGVGKIAGVYIEVASWGGVKNIFME
ncbi:MAG: hypothetical protein V1800_12065 [Candidatus Latescibacterota bacterium]